MGSEMCIRDRFNFIYDHHGPFHYGLGELSFTSGLKTIQDIFNTTFNALADNGVFLNFGILGNYLERDDKYSKSYVDAISVSNEDFVSVAVTDLRSSCFMTMAPDFPLREQVMKKLEKEGTQIKHNIYTVENMRDILCL